MNTSPVTDWEGATAYFTYADSGFGIAFWLIVSIAIVVGSIWYGTRHETADFKKHAPND